MIVNVLSSLRSRQEFVSRLYDDIVDGTVTFKKKSRSLKKEYGMRHLSHRVQVGISVMMLRTILYGD